MISCQSGRLVGVATNASRVRLATAIGVLACLVLPSRAPVKLVRGLAAFVVDIQRDRQTTRAWIQLGRTRPVRILQQGHILGTSSGGGTSFSAP